MVTYGTRALAEHQGKYIGLYLGPLVHFLNILGVLELVLFFVNPGWLICTWCIDGGRWQCHSGENQINHGQTKVAGTLDGAGHMLGKFFCCLGEQVNIAVG
jgi:hypothetical protein